MSNPAQRGGVAIGVPQTSVLCPSQFQARQFEYHPSLPLMAVGTVDGSVAVLDWQRNRALGRMDLPPLARPQQHAPHDVAAVLALAWMRGCSDRLLAAAADGSAAMFKIDLDAAAADDGDERMEAEQQERHAHSAAAASAAAAGAGGGSYRSRSSSRSSSQSCDPNALSLVHSYGAPLAPKLTSMHCNSSGTMLAASGYTHSVHVSDLETGAKLRVLHNIHEGHINIARFANHSPNLLLTCSFDRKLKLFDLRSNAHVGSSRSSSDGPPSSSRTPSPIYTCTSTSGVVMVTWSPNDLYFLSSAVDNEVRQFLSVDGRLHLEYDLPRHGSLTNYTRSYYANDGECIISGASSSDLLYVASSVDGSIIDSVDMVEGRREKTLYIQSLRGATIEHNRCAVLVFFKAHTDRPYELVDVNLNKDPTGRPRDLPMSLGSMRTLADDYRTFLNRDAFADVVISCQGATGSQLIYAHQAILRARWSWFRKWAQWSDEAISVRNDAAAAAAAAAADSAPPAGILSESQSLDDDDEDESMHAAAAGPASSAAPLSFCRIQVPPPPVDMQFDMQPVSSSAAAAAAPLGDTITLSSNGMVSLQLPTLSRAHCLYLLEFIYTGGIPIEAQSAAAEAAKQKADKAAVEQRGKRAKESAAADFERMSHAARVASSTSATSASSEVRGLDDDDDDSEYADRAAEQQAILASLTSTRASASPAASSPDLLDVHAALVALCMHATPTTALPFTPSHDTPFTNPPLRASFAEQLALYVPTTAAHYDLPRLANILERSMRRLLTLSLPANEVQPPTPAPWSRADMGGASSIVSSFSSHHPHLDALAHQLRLCVRYGAHGLVQCAQDLIHKSIDWLEFSAPSFVAQLPSIFPPSSSSNFLAELERAKQAPPPEGRDKCVMPLVGCGSAMVCTGRPGAPSMLVCCGGFGDKSAGAADEIHVIHPQTLRVTALTCSSAEADILPDVFCSHAMAALQSPTGEAMSLVVFGGGRDHVTDSLLLLDLHTLRWRRQRVSAATPLPHGRRKHTLTAVPASAFGSSASSSSPRMYVFGGRNRHSVFADLHYFQCGSDEWECVDLLEAARMTGHVPSQSQHPAARYGHTMTYSPSAGGLVLFGGFGVTGARNDVWLLDLRTHRWERKRVNDTSVVAGTLEEYELGLQSGGSEAIPLPRFQHSALLVTADGRDQLAVFGGMTAFAQGQSCFADLWLLDLGNWQWRKVRSRNTQPPRPEILDTDPQPVVDSKLDAWEAQLLPARRWDHTAFLIPQCGPATDLTSPTRFPRGGLPTSARLAVLGGVSNASQTVNCVDIFDFSTLTWTRSRSCLSGSSSLEPLINIVDSGCLWQDMQTRFLRTQPPPFAQPIAHVDSDVEEMQLAAGSTHAHLDSLLQQTPSTPAAPALSSFPSDGVSSSSSSGSGSGLSACIRFNMEHEQLLFSCPTPQCASSWVHFLVEGRVVSVPKLVAVSRCSTFLTALTSSMRDRHMEEHGLMRVDGVRYIVFRAVIYFLYCGDLELVIRVGQPAATGASTSSSCNSARGVKRCNGELATGSSDACSVMLTHLNDSDAETEASLAQLGSLEIESGAADPSSACAGQPNGKKRCRAKRMQADFAQHHPSLASHTPIPLEAVPPPLGCDPSQSPPAAAAVSASASASAVAAASSSPVVPSPCPSSSPPSVVEYVIDPLELLVAADRFNLSSLCSVVEIGLSRQLCVSAACQFLTFAETYHLRMLERLCHVFIIQRWEEVQAAHADDYRSLSAEARAAIETGLDAWAGSHRGPKNRNESNPLELPSGMGAAGAAGAGATVPAFPDPASLVDMLFGADGDAELDPAMLAMLGIQPPQLGEDEMDEEDEEDDDGTDEDNDGTDEDDDEE